LLLNPSAGPNSRMILLPGLVPLPAPVDLRRSSIEYRKRKLAKLLRRPELGVVLNEHYEGDGEIIFKHACKLGCEGIVSKRLGSFYRSGRSAQWVKVKNPKAPAVKREAEEDWGSPHWIRSKKPNAPP